MKIRQNSNHTITYHSRSDLFQPEGQCSYPFSTQVEDGIAKRRSKSRQPRLAYATRLLIIFHDVYFDLRNISDARHAISVEVVFNGATVFKVSTMKNGSAHGHHNASFYLRANDIRINIPAAVDGSKDFV